MGCVGQEGIEEHKNLNFRRKFLGGVSNVNASEAGSNQNHLFVLWERLEGLDQRFGVFFEGSNSLDWSWINPGGGEFDCSDMVAGGLKEWLELVPDPGSMKSVVN